MLREDRTPLSPVSLRSQPPPVTYYISSSQHPEPPASLQALPRLQPPSPEGVGQWAAGPATAVGGVGPGEASGDTQLPKAQASVRRGHGSPPGSSSSSMRRRCRRRRRGRQEGGTALRQRLKQPVSGTALPSGMSNQNIRVRLLEHEHEPGEYKHAFTF